MTLAPQAIFFDLDDTLLEFDAGARSCWVDICERYASSLHVSANELLDCIDQQRTSFWNSPESHQRGRLDLKKARREIVYSAIEHLHSGSAELADIIATDYATLRHQRLALFPWALPTLRALIQKRIKLALITNGQGEGQRNKVERFELERFFDCIIIEGEFGIGKPDARIFQHGLDQLSVQPTSTWMVGDDLRYDIAGAASIGLYTVWIDWRKNGLPKNKPATPDRIIERVDQLLSIL